MTHHHPKHRGVLHYGIRIASLAVVGLVAGCSVVAYFGKPVVKHEAPSLVQAGRALAVDVAPSAAQRRQAATWPGLEQDEINAITAKLSGMDSQIVVIFCESDAYCGDLQLDFDNALESAHWTTSFEKPFIDTTVGISTSSEALQRAITEATQGRITPVMIPKTAPYYALVIGHRSGKPVKAAANVLPAEVAVPKNDENSAPNLVTPEAAPAVAQPVEPATPVVVAEQPAEPVAAPAVAAPAPAVKPHHKRRHRHHRAVAVQPGHVFCGYPCNCFN